MGEVNSDVHIYQIRLYNKQDLSKKGGLSILIVETVVRQFF